ncbi:Tyrocidine synthase 2 [Pseudoalteromonas holothuriae]|uniref:Tyrocidine synthase 2 n=1 Tax=Pseudoalteromonas holothuriae TaxID=2963714 RepID=A0A9W4QTM4_9GAMM|nr:MULTISPECIES: non-ribosomal peptide synthetase [unclassified Pseudoalteromonas]CAH9050269.1 Tyrocidine synthase 2 [Pseudoalteromonas sp. CIP111951]CAH9052398.1 Tyrocidine synthase 2 [Pseudoalteromonas sp. CIP111854]
MNNQTSNLNDKRRALLQKLAQNKGIQLNAKKGIAKRQNDEHIPLSFAQQRLWFLSRLNSQGTEYNLHMAVKMTGAFCRDSFLQAWQQLVHNNPILRVNIVDRDGTPFQQVSELSQLPLQQHDLSRLSDNLEHELDRLRALDPNKPFDLSNEPLFRVRLIKMSDNEHVFTLTIHHIVTDGQSMELLVAQFSELYLSLSTGQTPNQVSTKLDYLDFCHWQRGDEFAKTLESLDAYWLEKLKGVAPLNSIPCDFVRPAVRQGKGTHLRVELCAKLTSKIRELSQQQDVTTYVFMQAAWSVLISMYAHSEEVVLGSPVSGRTQAGLDNIPGFFTNTLVLRHSVDLQDSFAQILAQHKEVVLQGLKHQDMPFDRLVDKLALQRDLSYTPIFQLSFTLQRGELLDQQLGDVKISNFAAQETGSQFDISLKVNDVYRYLACEWQYDSALFSEQTIQFLSQMYVRILEKVTAQPQCALEQLPLAHANQQAQMSKSLKQAAPQSQCLQQLFEQQVSKQPDQVAVVFEQQSLTYSELNVQANQLAHYLMAQGVKAETMVGISLPRSIDMTVAILAVLKAGGAYVPLDPSYPHSRIRYMLEDSKVSCILTSLSVQDTLTVESASLICLDSPEIKQVLAVQSAQNIKPEEISLTPLNLAYVIYTSGSTGNPKGAQVQHNNVVRLMSTAQQHFDFSSRDVWTMFHSYAFDFSVWEYWGALAFGGTLVVVPYTVSRSPDQFYQLLKQQQVTVLNQTPSAFYRLIDEDSKSGREKLPLRYVIFGGEALNFAQLRPWVDKYAEDAPELVNMYGITETTVHVTYRRIYQRDVMTDKTASFIGEPLSDLTVVLLNDAGQLVPDGLVGEMYVAGSGVCRGYLNQPQLTGQRFIHLEQFANTRFYRTGDLARRQLDGELVYLGRADQQVKIRGFRIELGEIEHAIRACENVKSAVVTARDNHHGDKHLVAYLVAKGQQKLALEQIKQLVKQELPEFMQPAAWVELEQLPLTSNGKVDIRALPAPDINDALATFVAPSSHSEIIMCDIWQQLLAVEKVGVLDNFFALGGDSILSLRVISMAQKAGLALTTQALYQATTLQALCRDLASQKNASDETKYVPPFAMLPKSVVNKLPESVVDAYPLTALQLGMVFHNQLSDSKEAYHNVYTLRLGLHADLHALKAVVADAIAEHEVLRTEFNFDLSDQPLQLVHDTVAANIELIDLTNVVDQEQAVIQWNIDEGQRHIPWQQAPLFKLVIFKLSEADSTLGYSGHHAMLDGWSLYKLLQQVVANYRLKLNQQPLTHHRFHLRFADYVSKERAAINGQLQKEFWHSYLIDAPFTRLPRTLNRDKAAPYNTVQLHVKSDVIKPLNDLAKELGVTMKSILLCAHLAVIRYVSAQQEMVTGLVSNGRLEHEEAADVLGLYLNSIPVRLALSGDQTWLQCIQQVAAEEAKLLPYCRFPLAELVKLNDKQELFEILFNYISMPGICAEADSTAALNAFGTVNYPLLCNAVYDPLNLLATINLSYNGKEFSEQQIQSYTGYFDKALRLMLSSGHAKLNSEGLMSAQEQSFLHSAHHDVQNWHYTECLHEKLFALPATYDQKAAVIYDQQQLTYAQLKQRATTLALTLQQLDVQPNQLVSIDCKNGILQVIAMLACSLSGAAYLPVDPDWPIARKHKVLTLGEVQVALCDEASHEQYNAAKLKIINLSAEHVWQQNIAVPLKKSVTSSDLAYVIFTSGSTGEPKGVMLTHQAVQNTLNDMVHRFELSDKYTVLGLSSISFDLSVFDVFASVQHGMTLVLPSVELRRNPEHWGELVRAHEVSVWNSVPAIFQLWVDYERSAQIPCQHNSLRQVFLSGDWLPVNLFADAKHIAQQAKIHSLGGATEAAIWSITYPIQHIESHWRSIPYGKAMTNQSFYVLNDDYQLCPVWTEGDLYIGGVGLALGYWRDEQRTSLQFIQHPQSGQRLYRTGDRGRFLDDANIEFLGRSDFQVQINGYRVELGEIETELNKQQDVKSSLLLVHKDNRGNAHLVAYVVPHGSKRPDVVLWSKSLAESLPHYMQPQQIITLQSWPLSDNGKVDRKALPEPEFMNQTLNVAVEKSANEKEHKLHEILIRLLKVDQLSVTDNLFMLGMDSIVAIQLVAQAKRESLSFSIQQLYQYNSIRELAAVIEDATITSGKQQFTEAQLLPIQHWFLYYFGRNANHFNQAFAFTCELLNWQALKNSVCELLQTHDVLSAYLSDGTIEINKTVTVDDVLQHFQLKEEVCMSEQVLSIAQTAQRSFDLNSGPLLKILYLEGSRGQHRLVFVCHHLIVDGVSWRVLLSDLEFAYDAAKNQTGRVLPLPEHNFAQWADWVIKTTDKINVDEQISFWRNQIIDNPLLPTLQPRHTDDNTYGHSQSETYSLNESLTAQLLGNANTKFNTETQDLFVTGLALALNQMSHHPQYSILMESHGRQHTELDLSRTVGWFTELYPVALHVDALQLSDTLIQIKETLRQCQSQSRSYGQIRYLSEHPEARNLRLIAEPQLLFNYLGQLDKVIDTNSVFQAAPESLGADIDERLVRPQQLEVTVMVVGGQAQLHCRYCPTMHSKQLIQQWLDQYAQALTQIIEMCTASNERCFTPSDVPESGMSFNEINDFLDELCD